MSKKLKQRYSRQSNSAKGSQLKARLAALPVERIPFTVTISQAFPEHDDEAADEGECQCEQCLSSWIYPPHDEAEGKDGGCLCEQCSPIEKENCEPFAFTIFI